MESQKTAAQLKPNESGVIDYFTDDKLALKLLDMGCLPGTRIELKFRAPLGDPLCIDVEGYRLSLRKAEASTITLKS